LQRAFPTCSSALWSDGIFPNVHHGFPSGEEARKDCNISWPQLRSTEKQQVPENSPSGMEHPHLKVCRNANVLHYAHALTFWDTHADLYEKEAGEFS